MSNDLPISKAQLKFEHGAFGLRFRGCASDQQIALVSVRHDNVCKPIEILEVIVFGKVHLVSRDEFVENAAKYHRMLGKEAILLLDSMHSSEQIFHEWALPKGWSEQLVAWASQGFSTKHIERYDKRFDDLWRATHSTLDRIKKQDLRYETLRDVGVSLHQVRVNLNSLNAEIGAYREGTISRAEEWTKGLEIVEGTSFQVLGLVPTIMMMDPFREAAYKISLVLTRMGARGIGAWLAESSIARELCGVLKQDVPPLIADLLTGATGRMGAVRKMSPVRREGIIFVVQQVVEFTCDVVLLVDQKGTRWDAADLRQLGEARLTSAVARFLSLGLGGSSYDRTGPSWKEKEVGKYVKSAIESMCNTIHRDLWAAFEQSKNRTPPSSAFEVFCEELPWMFVKIVQGTLVGGMQRQASGLGETGRRTGLEEQDGLNYIRDQNASAIFTGKAVGTKPLPKRGPLKPIGTIRELADKLRRASNLDLASVTHLRNVAHDQELYIAVRLPSPKAGELLAHHGVFPKPMTIKAKTVSMAGHPLEGRVARPTTEPPSHTKRDRSYDEAMKYWNEAAPHLAEIGCVVRSDGLVFHPKMLSHASQSDSDRTTAERAQKLLEKAKGFDLSSTENKALLASDPQAASFIDRAMVGFAGDLDLAEVVDARTSDRRVHGTGGEKEGSQEHTIARINQDLLDLTIRESNPLRDYKRKWMWTDPPARPGEKPTPDERNYIQHGGDYEMHTPKLEIKGVGTAFEGGPIFIMGPDDFYLRLDHESPGVRHLATKEEKSKEIRRLWEHVLQGRLGEKYKPNSVRGQQLRKASLLDDNFWHDANGNGQVIRTDRIERWTRYYEKQRHDLGGRGTMMNQKTAAVHSPTPSDVAASLIHRGLIPVWEEQSAAGDLAAVIQAERAHHVLIGRDTDSRNFVIAALTPKTIGQALVQIARAGRDSGLATRAGVTVWYELYTLYRPVTSDHILDRLGGRNPGITKATADVASQLSSQQRAGGRKLYAFCVEGFVDTYSPAPEEHHRALARLGFDKKYVDQAPPYPRTQGLKLADVWENQQNLELHSDPTLIGGRNVAVLTAGIATCPDSADLHHYWRPDAQSVRVA